MHAARGMLLHHEHAAARRCCPAGWDVGSKRLGRPRRIALVAIALQSVRSARCPELAHGSKVYPASTGSWDALSPALCSRPHPINDMVYRCWSAKGVWDDAGTRNCLRNDQLRTRIGSSEAVRGDQVKVGL